MLIKSISLLFIFSCAMLLQGCWEQAGVIVHEPGEYKGAPDSLTVDQAALQLRLAKQADR